RSTHQQVSIGKLKSASDITCRKPLQLPRLEPLGCEAPQPESQQPRPLRNLNRRKSVLRLSRQDFPNFFHGPCDKVSGQAIAVRLHYFPHSLPRRDPPLHHRVSNDDPALFIKFRQRDAKPPNVGLRDFVLPTCPPHRCFDLTAQPSSRQSKAEEGWIHLVAIRNEPENQVREQ